MMVFGKVIAIPTFILCGFINTFERIFSFMAITSRIQDDAIVLFQGDSVTDAGRIREDPKDMGSGYAMMAASWFNALYPERRVKFRNRGIGGDRVKDLLVRWDVDTIMLEPKPTWVSILVGVNNTWRAFDSNDPTSPAVFERQYRRLLQRTIEGLPGVRLVLCDPFMLPVSEWPANTTRSTSRSTRSSPRRPRGAPRNSGCPMASTRRRLARR
jgi:lysophospholipase L1-like esterase